VILKSNLTVLKFLPKEFVEKKSLPLKNFFKVIPEFSQHPSEVPLQFQVLFAYEKKHSIVLRIIA